MTDQPETPPQISPQFKAEIERLHGLGLTTRQAIDHVFATVLPDPAPDIDLRKPSDPYGSYQKLPPRRGKKPE